MALHRSQQQGGPRPRQGRQRRALRLQLSTGLIAAAVICAHAAQFWQSSLAFGRRQGMDTIFESMPQYDDHKNMPVQPDESLLFKVMHSLPSALPVGFFGRPSSDGFSESLKQVNKFTKKQLRSSQNALSDVFGGWKKGTIQDQFKRACRRAGGGEVVLGAAAGGGATGLCAGALLLSGEKRGLFWRGNATVLRRQLRKKLLWITGASAATAAYLSLQPTIEEGGWGWSAHASGTCRKLGRAAQAACHALTDEDPRHPHTRPAIRL